MAAVLGTGGAPALTRRPRSDVGRGQDGGSGRRPGRKPPLDSEASAVGRYDHPRRELPPRGTSGDGPAGSLRSRAGGPARARRGRRSQRLPPVARGGTPSPPASLLAPGAPSGRPRGDPRPGRRRRHRAGCLRSRAGGPPSVGSAAAGVQAQARIGAMFRALHAGSIRSTRTSKLRPWSLLATLTSIGASLPWRRSTNSIPTTLSLSSDLGSL